MRSLSFRLFTGVCTAALLSLSLPASAPAQQTPQAQTGTIRGRVTEARTDAPVGDAQVVILNSTAGAITTANGEFTITNVPVGARQVTVRRIGFAPQTRTVTVATNETVRLDLVLQPSATQLSQIVVTGTTGAVERRTVGNAVTQVNVAEVAEHNTLLNVTEALQGKSPGVQILPGSGAVGTAGEIRIRGAGSLSGYQPVVFVDGIRYNIESLGNFNPTGGGTALLGSASQVTSALNWLNPNDIESIEVIKGPAAATLYGAEAANGVIQIITKRGSKGQQNLSWNVRAERGTNEWALEPPRNYTTCDRISATSARTTDTVSVNGQFVPVWPGCFGQDSTLLISERSPIMTDPRATRTGDLSKLFLSVRGGGDRYSFFISGDRDVDQGVFLNNDVNRTSIRSNFSFTPSDKADFNVNLGWSDGRIRLPYQDESASGIYLNTLRWNPGRRAYVGQDPVDRGYRNLTPQASNRYRNLTGTEKLTLGATVNYTPFTWFRNRATVGVDNTTSQAQLLFLPGEVGAGTDPDAASGANLRRTPTARLLTLNYNGDLVFNPTPTVTSTTSFGSQVISDQRDRIDATGIGLGGEDVQLVNLAMTTTGGELYSENNSVGYYVQEQIGWKDRLFITGAVRADDHSSFGANFDWIVYPKLSASYVLSEEPALTRFTEAMRLNSLRLRAAWGQAGKAPAAYSAVQTYSVQRVTLGTTTALGAITSTYGNPDLKPERGEEIELGFDASALADRMGVDFTYYNRRTSDMLQTQSIAGSTGFIGTRFVNLGEVTNRGFEVGLFGTPVDLRSFRWESRVSLSTNRNRLESFGVEGKTVETPGQQVYGSVQQHRVGYPLGGYWVSRVLRCGQDPAPTNAATTGANACQWNLGEPYLTSAGAAIFAAGDTGRRYVGASTPTREIGFSNTFTLFRYFRVYGLLDYKGGFYQFNLMERNRCQSNDNCWRVNNPRHRFPTTQADSIARREFAVYRSGTPSDEWIQKADFVKLRELSLSMEMPRRWLGYTGASGAQFTISGRNLALWSDYEGVDPEVNTYGGRNFLRIDAYAAPMMRRVTAAVTLTY